MNSLIEFIIFLIGGYFGYITSVYITKKLINKYKKKRGSNNEFR